MMKAICLCFFLILFTSSICAQMDHNSEIKKSITLSSGYRYVHFQERQSKSFNHNGVKQTDIAFPSYNVFQLGVEFSTNQKKYLDFVYGFKAEIYSYKYLHMDFKSNVYYGQGGFYGPYSYLDSILKSHWLLSVNIPFLLTVNPLKNSRFKIMTGFSIDLYCHVVSKHIYHRGYEYYKNELQGPFNSLPAFFIKREMHAPMRANVSYIFKPRFVLNNKSRLPIGISPFFKITLLQQFGRSSDQAHKKYVSGLGFLFPLKYHLVTFGVELSFF